MKKISLFLIITLCLLLPVNVLAKTGTVYCPDNNDPLTIRSTMGGSAIGSASCNSKLEILEENVGKTVGCSSWYKIKYNNKEAYACGDYIKVDNSSYESGKVLCIENDDPLNIWYDVNKSKSLKQLSCNSELTVIEKNVASNSKCSNWYKVEHNSTVGYACGKYIDVSSQQGTTNPNVGKSSSADNIYVKDDYKDEIGNDGFIACYEDTTDVTLKSNAGSGSATGKAKCGELVKINSIKEAGGTCGYYYNITNSRNETGYLCGYFVNTTKLSDTALKYYSEKEDLEEYTNKLKNLKFPDSYIPYLLEIHARHPNWTFTPEFINLDFSDVVLNESFNGTSLLEGSYFNSNYLSMDINTYDILNNKFFDYDTEAGWYNASTEAIAYYLDPRTYLNEKYIFAFENLLYNSSHDTNMISKILASQTFWPSVYKNYSSDVASDIIKSAQEANISAIHIASRIKQEISGISTSDPRLGGSFTYNNKNYSGYYNFFNINVYGPNKIVNGMVYAMNNGWNTPYNAILGGAKFIRNDYIGVNQDTVYYEKFDVSTSNGHYTHQYQQNLAVVAQETNITYKSYVDMENYLDKAISFTIPVYNNMPNYAVTSPKLGNPNNYLKDIKIDGNTISGFNYDKYEYNITIPSNKDSIKVEATKIVNSTKVEGVGNINTPNSKTININVTAENGRVRTYKINITKEEKDEEDNEEEIVDMNTILNNIGIKYNNSYMFGLKLGTDSSNIINNVKKISEYATVNIKDKNNNPKSGALKTGDKVTISNKKETKSFTIVIYGDINADNKIDKDDCLAILRQLNGYTKLSGAYLESADANHDGKVNKDDCLAILRQLNGYADIKQ